MIKKKQSQNCTACTAGGTVLGLSYLAVRRTAIKLHLLD
jgi:hypothetical protein